MDQAEELLIANLFLPLVKDLMLPVFEKVFANDNDKFKKSQSLMINFEAYLSNKYLKYSYIDTITFPNKQTLFEQLYEPLTLTTHVKNRKETSVKIDKFPDEIFSNYYRFIIEDTAGMGKSTVLMKLFRTAIEEKKGIPILIPLRQINKDNDFILEIQNQISLTGGLIDKDTIYSLIKYKKFIFLLDGFDEISNSDRDFVIRDMHKFIEDAVDNYFVLSSRPEDSIKSFGDFQKFHVRPLDDDEAFSLIRRYDYYSFQPIANDLIKQLNDNTEQSLKEYLTNPFLVSLLYKSFDYRKDIPLKRSQFYRQVFDALFEAHDLSKEGYLRRDKHSKLHSDDFDRVLRHVGYLTSIENKVEYDRDYIINTINKSRKYVSDLSFKASDFLKDLLETVPLFREDGIYIKWAHKSLQDYYAAKFIWIDSKENQTKILRKIYDDPNNSRFVVVLDLLHELDISAFESTILLWILQEFEDHMLSYSNIQGITEDLIESRVERSFTHTFSVIFFSEKTFAKKYPNSDAPFISPEFNKSYDLSFEDVCLIKRVPDSKIVAICIIKLTKNNFEFMRLISRKHPKIFTQIPFQNSVTGKVSAPLNKIIDLDYTSNNCLNSPKMFDLTTSLMSIAFTSNYRYAKEYLEKLKSINQNDISNELTNW